MQKIDNIKSITLVPSALLKSLGIEYLRDKAIVAEPFLTDSEEYQINILNQKCINLFLLSLKSQRKSSFSTQYQNYKAYWDSLKNKITLKQQKEKVKNLFEHICNDTYSDIFNPEKNHYDKYVKLPKVSREEFCEIAMELLPEKYINNEKGGRKNRVYDEILDFEIQLVKERIRRHYFISFTQRIEDLPDIDKDVRDIRTVRSYIDSLLKFINIDVDLNYIPMSIRNELVWLEDRLKSDGLKINELNEFIWLSDSGNNNNIDKYNIMHNRSTIVDIVAFSVVIRQICLLNSKNRTEYDSYVKSFNEDKILQDFCMVAGYK